MSEDRMKLNSNWLSAVTRIGCYVNFGHSYAFYILKISIIVIIIVNFPSKKIFEIIVLFVMLPRL